MKHIIIGKRSNLSNALSKTLDDVIILSTSNIEDELQALQIPDDSSVNIIFNNFQPAVNLSNLDDPLGYVRHSILVTSIVLDFIEKHALPVHKVIYTSSSSVYGNNVFCDESDAVQPLSLHAALKIANEELVKKFCTDHGIDYTIGRIFNMYGGNDHFSVISKIVDCFDSDKPFTVINNGNAIRDFIHISDVVKAYRGLLDVEGIPILNIGSSEGVSIKGILDFLKLQGIHIKTINMKKDELKVSTSDNSRLCTLLGTKKFVKVEEELMKMLQSTKRWHRG